VVEGEADLETALVRDAKTGLWVLPATEAAIPYDLFSRPECDALFRRLAERFDYVLLDTPPILGVADARILAGKADRVLYVCSGTRPRCAPPSRPCRSCATAAPTSPAAC
jgi:Mrp family chromosome partitioning ATPase